MTTRPGVCVFCGSLPGANPAYAGAARELGALLAEADFDVVFGGSSDGCMGMLADAALARGGEVIGIAPPSLGSAEKLHKKLTRFEPVRDLAERKLRMLDLSIGALVLPGGTGTLDEFLEVLTMKRMSMVRHPLILIDVQGFFRPLDALLMHLIATGFMSETQKSLYQVVGEPAAAVRALRASFTAGCPGGISS
jgi:uncharacterized protein (TIGR00730 family)